MSMFNRLGTGIRIFFSRSSPYAVYKDPKSFFIVLFPYLLNMILKATSTLLNKKRVKCNICGWEGNIFGFGGSLSSQKISANHSCLRCNSVPRGRLLIRYLTEKVISENKKFRLLEIGPAKYTSEYFKTLDNIDYVSSDLFKGFSDLKMDVTNLEFDEEEFDLVICSHVLEHVEKYGQALEEIYRVLKLDGFGIIMVPLDLNLTETKKTGSQVFLEYGHRWNFGQDFLRALKSVGFAVEQINYCSYLPEKEIKKYGLIGEIIYQVARAKP